MRSARVASLGVLMLAMVLGSAFALAQPAGGPAGATTAPTTTPATVPSTVRRAAVINITGTIDSMTERYLRKSVESARKAGAEVIVIKLDTPGGVVLPTLRMTAFLRERAGLPTIAFVENQAMSAGAIIAVSCDYIAMERGAQIGDAAPISLVGNLADAERAKAVSPVAADLDASASRNGYSKLMLEALIIPERVVHLVQGPEGQKRLVNQEEFERLSAEGWKTGPGAHSPVDGPETLLTVEARQAEIIGLSRGTYDSFDEFAKSAGLQVVFRDSPPAVIMTSPRLS